MESIAILPCSAIDGPSIGTLNVHAFWTDITWVQLWPGKTRDYVASQAAKRGTHMLLSIQSRRRHLKAVDLANEGRIVAYARWVMPEERVADGDGENTPESTLWPEGEVPDVLDQERQQAQLMSGEADWEFDRALDVLDPPMLDMKEKWMRGKRYIREFDSPRSYCG